jgi:actin-related protein
MASLASIPYELPDGTIINVGVDRYLVPEMLCYPAQINAKGLVPILLSEVVQNTSCFPPRPGWMRVMGLDFEFLISPPELESIPTLMTKALLRTPVEHQEMLASSLVVVGGSAAFPGVPERLKLEISRQLLNSAPLLRIKTLRCLQLFNHDMELSHSPSPLISSHRITCVVPWLVSGRCLPGLVARLWRHLVVLTRCGCLEKSTTNMGQATLTRSVLNL